MPIFTYRSIIPASMAQILAFHNHPKALSRLTPPLVFTQIHRDERTSLTDGELEFTLWFGPVPARWIARHEPGPTDTSFADRQVSGPLASWRHEHIFRQVPGGIELTDRVVYEHRQSGLWSIFTHIVFNPFMLRLLFLYRHLRTRIGVRQYASLDDAA